MGNNLYIFYAFCIANILKNLLQLSIPGQTIYMTRYLAYNGQLSQVIDPPGTKPTLLRNIQNLIENTWDTEKVQILESKFYHFILNLVHDNI